MALRVTDVGAAPARIAGAGATFALENLGQRPLRFVVGQSAGEAAPSDLGAGHLLLPGRRETVRLGDAANPVWVWSDYPTRVGVSAALAG